MLVRKILILLYKITCWTDIGVRNDYSRRLDDLKHYETNWIRNGNFERADNKTRLLYRELCHSSNVSIRNRYSNEPYTKSMFERKKKPWHLNGYKTTSVLMPAMRLLSNIRTGLLIWNPCRVNLHKNGVDHRARGGRSGGAFNTFHRSHKFDYKTRTTFTVTILDPSFWKTPKQISALADAYRRNYPSIFSDRLLLIDN